MVSRSTPGFRNIPLTGNWTPTQTAIIDQLACVKLKQDQLGIVTGQRLHPRRESRGASRMDRDPEADRQCLQTLV